MTPSSGPILPNHAGGPSRVIQGYFPGGKPRIIQAAPAMPARPSIPAPVQVRPATGALQPARPGQPPRPILPTNSLQPRGPSSPRHQSARQIPQPILPRSAASGTLQISSGGVATPSPCRRTSRSKPGAAAASAPARIDPEEDGILLQDQLRRTSRVHVGHEARHRSSSPWRFTRTAATSTSPRASTTLSRARGNNCSATS